MWERKRNIYLYLYKKKERKGRKERKEKEERERVDETVGYIPICYELFGVNVDSNLIISIYMLAHSNQE
jgi:hypothetical protein